MNIPISRESLFVRLIKSWWSVGWGRDQAEVEVVVGGRKTPVQRCNRRTTVSLLWINEKSKQNKNRGSVMACNLVFVALRNFILPRSHCPFRRGVVFLCSIHPRGCQRVWISPLCPTLCCTRTGFPSRCSVAPCRSWSGGLRLSRAVFSRCHD